ncbi:hypothetical protein BUALT_Bualt07G0037300 [Buddleja alternifolia]|uniref:RNase III domain-containing protein n=1 Tax=Buddleja alternifolia TaxID=168488 RepID=A0AAV6XIR2_9LAMI|nr:hypothetical protein BUALT_Bualt07G0037300 [Buddleja alternifolia]
MLIDKKAALNVLESTGGRNEKILAKMLRQGVWRAEIFPKVDETTSVVRASRRYKKPVSPSGDVRISKLYSICITQNHLVDCLVFPQKGDSYTFKDDELLRRALTHASFSGENNKALSILGASIIETSVALQSLIKDVDISAKDLNNRIAEVSKVESSGTADGTRLGLQKMVRVSPKTDATAPAVIVVHSRIFGAIAVDTGCSDEAGRIFGKIRGGIGRAMTV